MLWIILAIIAFFILFFAIGFAGGDGEFTLKKSSNLLCILAFLLLLPGFITIIPANTVGVVFSPINGLKEETLAEGFHTKGILDKVYKINTAVQTKTIEGVSGQTKDSQYISMNLDIKYKVDTANAFEVFRQFKTLNNVDEQLIATAAQRSIESVTTKYNIMDILGQSRSAIYAEIESEMQTRLAASGITFYSITFVDTDAGSEIEKAIKDEAVAKKEVETAQQALEKSQIEAQRRVAEAQADQEKAKIEAETAIIEAQGQAEANTVLAQSLTPEILKQEYINKWNGELPQVVTNSASVLYGME